MTAAHTVAVRDSLTYDDGPEEEGAEENRTKVYDRAPGHDRCFESDEPLQTLLFHRAKFRTMATTNSGALRKAVFKNPDNIESQFYMPVKEDALIKKKTEILNLVKSYR